MWKNFNRKIWKKGTENVNGKSLLSINMPNVAYPIEGADFFEEEEVNAYKKIYKYYPTTFETSIAL